MIATTPDHYPRFAVVKKLDQSHRNSEVPL